MADSTERPEPDSTDESWETAESPAQSLADAASDASTVEDLASSVVDRELEIFQDLQRLQADFVNYRSRVERDRGLERQVAVAEVLKAFLPALDDIERAEKHGDLAEGSAMAAVATKIRAAGDRFGLERFGAVGDPFDPALHDALVQTPNPDVSAPSVAEVVECGYRVGDRQLRAARVAVWVPGGEG
jgi:molecular chaperone GrpE